MPEEQNRKVTDALSTVLLTHCEDANENLRAEGVAEDLISFVGNTMIDTLLDNVDAARELAAWEAFGVERRGYILATLHRPALVDDSTLLSATLTALAEVARGIPVVFPMHPRTRSRLAGLGLDTGGIKIVEPLPYRAFLSLEAGAAAVITDSGGVQEETTALDVPCFTLRANTERPVTISHGTNTLLGLDPSRLIEVPGLIAGNRAHERGPAALGRVRRRARRTRDRARARARARGCSVTMLASAPMATSLSPLCVGALEFLGNAYDEERALFSYSARFVDGRFVNDFENPLALRYTVNTLLAARMRRVSAQSPRTGAAQAGRGRGPCGDHVRTRTRSPGSCGERGPCATDPRLRGHRRNRGSPRPGWRAWTSDLYR